MSDSFWSDLIIMCVFMQLASKQKKVVTRGLALAFKFSIPKVAVKI